MQPVQQTIAAQGDFSIIGYELGRGFQGYALRRRLGQQLQEQGLRVGRYGHIVAQEAQLPNLVPVPGFLWGDIATGYRLRIHLPNDPQFQAPSFVLKDICDRL